MTASDKGWLALVRGEHVLSFAPTEAERQAVLARWVLTGLEGGERFVYAEPDGHAPSRSLVALLDSQQFDAGAAARDGRLVQMTVGDFYAPDAPATITATARADGFSSVRVATWAGDVLQQLGRERLIAYEGELGRACASRTFAALCQYDLLSAGEWLTMVAQLHQLTGEASPYFAVPSNGTIMLFGEIDTTNSELLARSLRDAVHDVDAELRVDLDGVQLMSAAGCRAILQGTEAFRERGGRVVLLAHRPLVTRVLQLMRMGSVTGITVTDEAR